MTAKTFDLWHPRQRDSAVIFAAPHSGRDYADDFLAQSVLDPLAIRSSEDAFVDELFASAPLVGSPFLVARVPRAYVDLNRAAEELDPALILDVPKGGHNPRVHSGLGVIPRVVAGGRAIYRGKLPLIEAQERLARHWHPYHATLGALLTGTQRDFGRAVLIDCHSMPHEALGNLTGNAARPDVVLGDRFGAAAAGDVVDAIEAIFIRAGFRVSRNLPFAGAYVAQTYGQPRLGRHVVQIEIDRSLYMDEARVEKRADFDDFAALMSGIVAELAALGRMTDALAAE